MKILEICPFSAGICGVFARVKEESLRLKEKGHEVKIFSSNLEKGTNKIASETDIIKDIEITRFPAKRLGGESFMSWNFESALLDYNPNIIIAHSYRHLHTTRALKLAKKIGAKIFLVTHAPFARNRSFLQSIIVSIYDNTIGRATINKFDNVIAITKWELPYLKAIGLKENKISYIPNGIPEEFFEQKAEKNKKTKEKETKIIFLGRISPIKSLETIIKAFHLIKNKSITLEIVGPAEPAYLEYLKSLISKLNLQKQITFSPAIYDLKEKIEKIDSCDIFILPSITEGMPQSLIETMARGKIVIASNNLASKDIIKDNKNGFLFKVKDESDLADKINKILNTNRKTLDNIRTNAKDSVKQFSWDKIINQLENLITK